MADGKWISELTADTPLTDAARRVLSVRLGVVRDYLPKAMRQADEDPEHVHQLRVATRRAAAALDIVSVCLPPKDHNRARKTLRRIRRAAGEARDWDVFVMGLPNWTAVRLLPGRDLVAGYALGRRAAAQDLVADASPNFPFDFDRFLAEIVASVHKPRGHPGLKTLLDLARPMLSGLLDELHQATAGDLTDYNHLHQVRIIGKRLRYAMEVFVDGFPGEFREQLYPAVERMQEILGEANDSHVAGQRLAELADRRRTLKTEDWRRCKPGIDRLKKFHEQRVERQRLEFIDWWKSWQQSGGEAAFAELLKPAPQAAPLDGAASAPDASLADGHAV
jgi:CHAD domain-containing protein